MSKLIRAIDKAERIAKLVERGRLDDAICEFSSDCHDDLVEALNSQLPGHMDKPLGRHLEGLLKALTQIKPNSYGSATYGPADPETIRSYCRDIKGLSPGSDPAKPSEANTEIPESKAGWWSCADLAKKHGVNQGNLRKRLGRWRKQNGEGWMEVPKSDRTSRSPIFLYRSDAVETVIDDMPGQ